MNQMAKIKDEGRWKGGLACWRIRKRRDSADDISHFVAPAPHAPHQEESEQPQRSTAVATVPTSPSPTVGCDTPRVEPCPPSRDEGGRT